MRAYLVPVLCLTLIGGAANASTTYEDDGAGVGDPRPNASAARAAFLAAAGAVQPIIDFEAIALGYGSPISLAPGVDVAFGGADGGTISGVSDDDHTDLGFNTTAGGSRFLRFAPQFAGLANLTFSFTNSVRAFGAYFTGVETDFGSISVTSSDGSVQDFALTGSTTGGGSCSSDSRTWQHQLRRSPSPMKPEPTGAT